MRMRLIGTGVILCTLFVAVLLGITSPKDYYRVLDEVTLVSTLTSSSQSTLEFGPTILPNVSNDKGVCVNFSVKNDRNVPISISLESKSCGCIELELPNRSLDAGETSVIEMRFSAFAYPSSLDHYVCFRFFNSKDPNDSFFHVFTIKGYLIPEVWLDGEQHVSVLPGTVSQLIGHVYVAREADFVPRLRVSANISSVSLYFGEPTTVEMGCSRIFSARWPIYAKAVEASDLFQAISKRSAGISGDFSIVLPESARTYEFSITREQKLIVLPKTIVISRGQQTVKLLIVEKGVSVDSVESFNSAIACSIKKVTENANGTVLEILIKCDLPSIISSANGEPVFLDTLTFGSTKNAFSDFLVQIVFWVNELDEKKP